jgi:hypothetical protein
MASGELNQRIEAIAAILTLAGRLPNLPKNLDTLYTPQYLDPVAQTTAQRQAAQAPTTATAHPISPA